MHKRHAIVRLSSLAAVSIAALVFGACGAHELSLAPPPAVNFYLDAPFCGGNFIIQLFIDNVQVAIDTFRVNVASPHKTSRDFATSAGQHTLHARTLFGYVFPDKPVSLTSGQTVTDSLPFYCS